LANAVHFPQFPFLKKYFQKVFPKKVFPKKVFPKKYSPKKQIPKIPSWEKKCRGKIFHHGKLPFFGKFPFSEHAFFGHSISSPLATGLIQNPTATSYPEISFPIITIM